MRELTAGLVLALVLAGCGGTGGRAPAVDGQVVGNGGDTIRVIVEQGRFHALRVLSVVDKAADFPSVAKSGLRAGELEWIVSHRAELAEDIRASEHVWLDKVPANRCQYDSCGCTTLQPKARILFSLAECSAKIATRQQAGQLLVHESVHHLLGEDESKADRIAASLYIAWLGLGHPEAPHWSRVDNFESFFPNNMAWTGTELVFPGDDGTLHLFDPGKRAWRRHVAENGREFWKTVIVAYYAMFAYWADGKFVLYNGSSFGSLLYDSAANRWSRPAERRGPGLRRGALVNARGARMIVWGGIAEEEPARGSHRRDGAIYDARNDTWSPVPHCAVASALYLQTESPVSVLTDDHFIAWGGSRGIVVDLKSLKCREMSAEQAPSPQPDSAFWTGKEMYVSGAFYNPATDRWRSMSRIGAPAQTALSVWSGAHLYVLDKQLHAYDLERDRWETLDRVVNPAATWGRHVRSFWTGLEWLVWTPQQTSSAFLFTP